MDGSQADQPDSAYSATQHSADSIQVPRTIHGVNRLPSAQKRQIYTRLIPLELRERFNLPPDLVTSQGHDLLTLKCEPGSTLAEMELYHQVTFPDPVLYGHITDTINGQIHVMLYVLNDPTSPRFDIDYMPDGTPTKFGTQYRNLEAELAAMRFGLAPGQVRRGLRLLGEAIHAFEGFVASLGHELYFAEPLYYHNAVIFERYGFAYERGRRLMQRIQDGFELGGDLAARLDGANPFHMPGAASSIRLRSWALHDNLMSEPYTGVTMYKHIGKSAGLNTCPGCRW
jgi:acetoin utilization protein AcuC